MCGSVCRKHTHIKLAFLRDSKHRLQKLANATQTAFNILPLTFSVILPFLIFSTMLSVVFVVVRCKLVLKHYV